MLFIKTGPGWLKELFISNGLCENNIRLSTPFINGFNDNLQGPEPVATFSVTIWPKSSTIVFLILSVKAFVSGTILNFFIILAINIPHKTERFKHLSQPETCYE